jgi:hypothetical protein
MDLSTYIYDLIICYDINKIKLTTYQSYLFIQGGL